MQKLTNHLRDTSLGIYDEIQVRQVMMYQKLQAARERVFVLDLACTTTRNIFAAVYRIFNAHYCDPEDLKTHRVRNWERETAELRLNLAPKPEMVAFCQNTAASVDAIVVQSTGELLWGIPQKVENVVFFWLGWPLRYGHRQLTKQGGREAVIENGEVKHTLQPSYRGFATRAAHGIGRPFFSSLLNTELLLLRVCQKFTCGESEEPFPLKEIVFKRLAKSVAQQAELEKIWTSRRGNEGEKWIQVLQWLKEQGDLPKGLPDPEGLLSGNIGEKEEEALTRYVEGLVTRFLDRHAPQGVTSGLNGWVYRLEGKDAFVSLATTLIIQTLISQVADPHQFAQTILYSQGEVMDLEERGFGFNQGDQIFDVGHQMLEAIQKGKSIQHIFTSSGLKSCPGGIEGIKQKEATRVQLKAYVVSLFMQMFKSDGADGSSFEAPKSIFGGGSVGWHLLMDMADFGIQHLKGFSLFAAEAVQKNIASYFAGRMVDLIYHPSWKIVLLQLIEALAEGAPEGEEGKIEKEDFDHVAQFLGRHFFGAFQANHLPAVTRVQTVTWGFRKVLEQFGWGTERSLGELITNLGLYCTSEALYQKFMERIYPKPEESDAAEASQPLPRRSFLEEKMEALSPSMRENLLYCRLSDAIRKKGQAFDDDVLFWEMFLRICLNQSVNKEVAHRYTRMATQEEIAGIRTEKVTELLLLDEDALIEHLRGLEVGKVESFEVEDFIEEGEDGAVVMLDESVLRDTIEQLQESYIQT